MGVSGAPIGEQLAQLRRESGYTQVELAEQTGMTQSAVSRIERSEDVRWSTILRYVQGCGCRSAWLEAATS